MPTVYERVKAVVADKLSVEEEDVAEDSAFVEDLNADSLDLVEFVMALEEEFKADVSEESKGGTGDFHIPDEDAGQIKTVAQAVEYLKEHGVQDV